eukprot:COSAG06_NODE_2820_length_6233_cov_12.699463_2_plen_198_part_00
MVSEIIQQDLVKWLILPFTIIPCFALTFTVFFRFVYHSPDADMHGQWLDDFSPAIEHAAQAHQSFSKSMETLVLMSIGMADPVVFGRLGAWAHAWPVQGLMLLFVFVMPIVVINLLVAMMSDTYVSVWAAAYNRWSLKQAQYIFTRKHFAARWTKTHLTSTDGYVFEGHFDEFFGGENFHQHVRHFRLLQLQGFLVR